MSLNENIPLRKEVKLLPERASAWMSDEEKLKASLAYRALGEKDASLVPEELGTAEHRPKRGMIYDAPLGLKF